MTTKFQGNIPQGSNNQQAIVIEATIHAREWITSATATWILNELLTSTDPEVMQMASTIDWYFIPVFNADGFVYTKTTVKCLRID